MGDDTCTPDLICAAVGIVTRPGGTEIPPPSLDDESAAEK